MASLGNSAQNIHKPADYYNAVQEQVEPTKAITVETMMDAFENIVNSLECQIKALEDSLIRPKSKIECDNVACGEKLLPEKMAEKISRLHNVHQRMAALECDVNEQLAGWKLK